MGNHIYEQRELLIKLQSFEKRKMELDKILVSIEDEVAAVEKKYMQEEILFDSMKTELAEKKKQYVMYENDVEANISRIKKYEEHLKKLSSPKDYKALQREVDETKKINGEIQETMLELLEAIESIEEKIKDKEPFLVQLKSQVASEKEDIIKKAADEKKEKEEIKESKKTIFEELDPEIKLYYEDMVKKTAGNVIVPIKKQVCHGCFLRVPPQILIELRKSDDLILCPRCHRVVYVEEDRVL